MQSVAESCITHEGKMNFYLLNRGILISAKEVSYSNYSNEVTISFEDFDVHGNVDGGHTYKMILQERDQIDFGQQYVKIEILVGVEGIFQALAAARNTSVQVQDKSIAELEDRFDIIKSALAGENYMSRIFFKENDSVVFISCVTPGASNVLCQEERTIVVDEPIAESEVQVYPNPTKSDLNIRSTSDKLLSVQIYDGMGRLLLEQTGGGEEVQIDMDRLATGTYYLQILTSKEVLQRKVIKL